MKVKVEKGYVTLKGEVDWHFQQEAARTAVRSLGGVTGVLNQITIKVHPNTTTIRDDIIHAQHRSWFFDDNNIQVSADGGKVRLTGSVNSWMDRQTATATAWAAPGTTSVENNIRVS